MLGISEDVALLRLLAAAPALAEGWDDFLQALRRRTAADEAALIIQLRSREWRFATGALPLPEPQQSLRSERVYAQDEFAAGTSPLRLLALTQRGGLQARLAISHPFNDFRATDTALMARLAPHLDQALNVWLLLSRERAARTESATAAAALGAYWLWLEPSGRIVEAAPGLWSLLEQSEPLRLVSGRLEVTDPLRARAFRRALDDAPTAPFPPEVRLGSGLSLFLHPGLQSPAPGVDPVIRGVLRHAPVARDRDPEALARHLGISRSEARLAALICDGFTLAEASQQLGWTIETTHSASKRLYQLTGTAGQSGLMRRMLTTSLWFQPD